MIYFCWDGNEDENEGEAPTPEDAEDEFIEDLIYSDPAVNEARKQTYRKNWLFHAP